MVPPGVDTDVFVPGDQRAARMRHGFGADERVIVFAGRIQPLKGPDVLLRAAAVLRERQPDERWRIVVVGGLSGVGRVGPHGLAEMAASLGIADLVTFLPPQPRELLAELFRAADVVAVPSYNESFGLVALEAQACGTPVVAAAVGGLRVAVQDGVTGVLVDGHDAADWASALAGVALDRSAPRPSGRRRPGAGREVLLGRHRRRAAGRATNGAQHELRAVAAVTDHRAVVTGRADRGGGAVRRGRSRVRSC